MMTWCSWWPRHHRHHRRIAAGLAVPVLLSAAACASSPAVRSSSTSAAPPASPPAATPASPSLPAPASPAAPDLDLTVAAAAVPGVGTVLVNGRGQTLYVLSVEAGGRTACTSANGCLTAWPDLTLPSGTAAATAGTGAEASKLGTVTGPDGIARVSYAGYPLYTFAGDHGPGTANGEGRASFGGIWYTMAPDGVPVRPGAPAAGGAQRSPSPADSPRPSPSPSPSPYGGYGY
jgi:predicted lipoprotein with Yx(FWY)xxD motif